MAWTLIETKGGDPLHFTNNPYDWTETRLIEREDGSQFVLSRVNSTWEAMGQQVFGKWDTIEEVRGPTKSERDPWLDAPPAALVARMMVECGAMDPEEADQFKEDLKEGKYR